MKIYNDLIPREVARRIIDSPRNKEQMLGMLQSVPSVSAESGDLISRFRDYQIEWLTAHNDIEFVPEEEKLIIQFLEDTAECFTDELPTIQPTGDLISRAEADALFQQAIDSKSPNLKEDWKKLIWVREHIKDLPTIQPTEPRKENE